MKRSVYTTFLLSDTCPIPHTVSFNVLAEHSEYASRCRQWISTFNKDKVKRRVRVSLIYPCFGDTEMWRPTCQVWRGTCTHDHWFDNSLQSIWSIASDNLDALMDMTSLTLFCLEDYLKGFDTFLSVQALRSPKALRGGHFHKKHFPIFKVVLGLVS